MLVRTRFARGLAVIGLTLALVSGGTSAAAADSPFQRGPDPTRASVEASAGTFAITQSTIPSSARGFGGGIIYYPTSTAEGIFGAVAISPGFTARWSSISWIGQIGRAHV